MDERVLRFRVGVVVLAAALITCILIMLLGEGQSIFQRRYTIYLRFPQAPGVTVDTPVRKDGVLIGRVSDVKLLDEGGVLLKVWIDSRYTLRRSEVPRISTSSLLGDAVVEFVPRGQPQSSSRLRPAVTTAAASEPIAPSEVIQEGDLIADGIVASDPLRVLMNLERNMQGTIDSMGQAADEVAQLARSLNNTLNSNQGQFQRIIEKSELALDTLRTTMTTVDSLLGDREMQETIKRSLQGLPQLFDDIRVTMTDAQKTLAGFERVSSKAEQNLDNLEAFTRPLASRGESLVSNIDRTISNLDEVLAQMVQFSRAMNSGEGTLGRLVRDDELYDRLELATSNIEDATRRIRPILDDVRVFTDKIATDPRQLGVKGALDRRPLGVGLKTLP